ncbi:protein kinase domain-containing protein [Edaphobacter bradus]|uniref:protein kinase domain-containing protein n=1 Tax=Edaphobacter bradus TaxID=2259016 RepID=UPI0021E089BE|nr:SPOR domain-containing protein [Edaphobacter bradus]
MQLWNDYEGRTIAKAYPLDKLLRPEGRSAFFTTTNGTGRQSVIRLIEAHFDESEILRRWRVISEIQQPNLVGIRKFGEAELDGTALVYAVMEPTEANLSEVLAARTLTVEEARELAESLIDALQALHERGLVHEHIQPENIFAEGETVKLRSDCIREATAGLDEGSPEAAERVARDVHDLAVVLLEAMTGRRSLQGSATVLPTPFDGIIRNGLSGKWGLAHMAAALQPARPTTPAAPTTIPSAVTSPKAVAATIAERPAAPQAAAVSARIAPAQAPAQQPMSERRAVQQPVAQQPVMQQPVGRRKVEPVRPSIAPDVRHRIVKPVVEKDWLRNKKTWLAGAVAALVLFLGWYLLRDGNKAAEQTPIPATTTNTPAQKTSTPVQAPVQTTPVPVRTPKPTAAALAEAAGNAASARPQQWRVVAYTYNHEDQAQKKAASIASRNPQLNPQVFSPSGRAPYLVTLGGPMSRDEAAAFRRKAVASGLASDTYIQNFRR